MTRELLKQCLPDASEIKLMYFSKPLAEVMAKFEINTPNRQAAFLAQIAHESGCLRYVKEIASGESYEDRHDLGNTEPGDGPRYKGRGLIQLTGRTNYRLFSEKFQMDVISHPEILEEPLLATLVAGWYWDRHNLNELADQGTEEAFKEITRKINGGLNGYSNRVHYWNICREALT